MKSGQGQVLNCALSIPSPAIVGLATSRPRLTLYILPEHLIDELGDLHAL